MARKKKTEVVTNEVTETSTDTVVDTTVEVEEKSTETVKTESQKNTTGKVPFKSKFL